MKLVLAVTLALAACGPTKAKPESALVPNVQEVPETCCCKSTPMTSDDGKPVYEMLVRMECSTRQGDCVDDVQCQKAPQPN